MDTEVELDLSPSDRQRNPQGSGRIKIHICLQKPDVAVVAAITDARKDASTVGIGSAITVSEYVDNAQTAISSQSGTFSALGAVLSKIDVFVNIVDRTANVRDSGYLKFIFIHLPLGTPLR
jgi:DNA-binding transcriptional regulator LsrR (DeoR family)